MKKILSPLLGLFILPSCLLADVTLPKVFGDNMVLQQGKPLAVWGNAAPGEQVTVGFGGQKKSVVTGADGLWTTRLDPLTASSTPAELTVSGKNSLVLKNVLVGEVWICSGQSNMEKPLGMQSGQQPTLNFPEELKAAKFPQIRLFKIPKTAAATPAADVDAAWTVCSPDTLDAIHFSAAGYFFGRRLHRELNVPVGLIDSSWGGSRIESWTSPEGFDAVPSLADFAAASHKPGARIAGIVPSLNYNGMIAPLTSFTLRGAIWYQGESNVTIDDGMHYADKMEALVRGWRMAWKSELPFYYVQIAPFHYFTRTPPMAASPEAEPRLWEAQTAAMQLPRTGMIVTTDLVNDLMNIHPLNKKDIGERLAAWALAKDYGKTDVVYSGPLYRAMKVKESSVLLAFHHTEGGLMSSDRKPLTWFTIAGEDGKFSPATATIEGDFISVTSPEVPAPKTVRFAWDEGAQPNLVNKAGLPASPFRTDAPAWQPSQGSSH